MNAIVTVVAVLLMIQDAQTYVANFFRNAPFRRRARVSLLRHPFAP